MNVFARPVQDMPEPLTRRLRWGFVALFLIGGALRCYASFTTLAIMHPDEHQQFLEQAQRYVYGYGHLFWEQTDGLRHPLYPRLLAVPLAGMESVGIRDSLIQGCLMRWIVSLIALFAWSLFAWELHRRGDTMASLLMMCTIAFAPDIIYIHIHPLSETGATITFLIALVLLGRHPFWAGALLAISFGIRFQMGFIVGATVIFVWVMNRCRFDRPFLRLSLGFALAMFGLCLADKIVHGGWLHSPVAYYDATVVRDLASMWGVEPWYAYILWMGNGGLALVVPLGLLVLVGVRREWPLMLLVVAFVVPHSIVPHKEGRFMLPVAPLMLALVSVGYSELARMCDVRFRRRLYGLALIGLIVVVVVRLPQILWNISPYGPTANLLHDAGKREDLTGIIICGADRSECGNYFYLRRNVPLVVVWEHPVEDLPKINAAHGGKINYLMCWKKYADQFEAYGPVKIAESGYYVLYQLKAPPR